MVKLLTRNGADVNQVDTNSTVCPLYLALKSEAGKEIVDHLLYNVAPQKIFINRTERLFLEMSPVFFCLLSRDMQRLKQLIEVGLQTGEITYLIQTKCNHIPLAYYCLMKMEIMMIQANEMAVGGDGLNQVKNETDKYKHEEGDKKQLMQKKQQEKLSIKDLAQDL